jgi:uncharacterized protein (TIGR01777 family)
MTKNILITGGTGLVGQKLTDVLLAKGYNISYLTRNKKGIDSLEYKTETPLAERVEGTEEALKNKALGKRLAQELIVTNIDQFLDPKTGKVVQTERHEILLQKGHLITDYDIESILETNVPFVVIQKQNAYIKLYEWNIQTQTMEDDAIKNADYIIHLAGAGVADENWTVLRKKEIMESRTLSTMLLANKIEMLPNHIKAFVSASAIGYYGMDTGNAWQYESMETKADDFLTSVVKAWESAVFKIKNTRLVVLRIGVVLSQQGGALEKMSQPVRIYAGAALGNGLQYISWVHIADLCQMFVKAIEDEQMTGIYNAVAPQPVTNEVFTKAIGKTLDKPILPINVPNFALKLLLGEMAALVIGGNRVSSDKIEKTGFHFQFKEVNSALKDLLQP